MMPNWEDVSNRLTSMALSPTGKRVVVEARGEIFTIPADKGDVRNLTHSSGSAERDPAWSPDGKSVSYFSDKSGEYKLIIEAQDGLTHRVRSIYLSQRTTTHRHGHLIPKRSFTQTPISRFG
jgi:Periplasmic component of the Tol biopolymer transport system